MTQKLGPVLFVIAVAAASAWPSAATAQSLHAQLQQQIPQIIEFLHDKGHRTVGVLKFRVKKHGDPATDSAGPLNSLMADRLEVGLILANSFQPSQQLRIIRDASAQAAQRAGVSHLQDAGRTALFARPYRLAWGQESLPADVFLTGVVQVHEDNARCTVGVLAFDRSGGPLQRCCEVFDADLDPALLGELGESFVLRGAFDSGATRLADRAAAKEVTKKIVQQTHAVKTQLVEFPLLAEDAPVKLEIRYDGQPVALRVRDGKAFVREPTAGQTVELAIVRGAAAQGVLGVVVRVNGENTLGRQTLSDLECRKWLLTPDHHRTVIRGYQISGDTIEAFRVLSDSESQQRAINYGRYVGQIQLTVFPQLEERALHVPELNDTEEDLAAMLRGVQPAQPPGNLSALKGLIRNPTVKTRGGLIVPGAQRGGKIRSVSFEPAQTPIMSATVTYYTP
ncbi:MAG: hypothetical protein NXI04_01710 [Planctomycetaceae bacterium]|nr:hypothetical protein [Planctomycetaceae bacterium]